MSDVREGGSVTVLTDGRVLIAGGRGNKSYLATAELYDPQTGKFSSTGSMSTPRAGQSAVLLGDGRVLMVGGNGLTSMSGLSLEVYDPSTGKFSSIGPATTPNPACPPGGSCAVAFAAPLDGHSATLLPDGKVLIAGGSVEIGSTAPVAKAQLFDPQTGELTPTGSMATPRLGHVATLLANGLVLIIGGQEAGKAASAELYDPSSGTFRATGSMKVARLDPAVSLLADGRVLVAGGYETAGTTSRALASAELYDPATGTFSLTGSMTSPRFEASPTLLSDGRVFIAGGHGDSTTLATTELYDPQTGTFSPGGSMVVAREGQEAVLLKDGSVLILGGFGPNSVGLASAEICRP